MPLRPKASSGFTLIELLVVVSIIGVLSSIVLASLTTARAKARDAERLSDLHQLRNAFELYANDHGGKYPCELATSCPGQAVNANGRVGEGSGLDTLLAPYMGRIPRDPLGPSATYNYYYDGRQSCSGQVVAVIFARTMETRAGNGSSLCTSWGGEGGAGTANAYHEILGPSAG